MDFIEDPQTRSGKLALEDAFAVLGHVKTEIPRRGTGQTQRKCSLADLPWAGDKNHLARQVLANLRLKITVILGHSPRYGNFR